MQPTQVVHTHAHIDHLGASAAVAALGEHSEALGGQGALLGLHRGDAWLWDNVRLQAESFGMETPVTLPITHWIEHHERLPLAQTHLQVLHTPGHTPGSCCFLLAREGEPPLVLSGDTIFNGSVGRTDLWGGDRERLVQSISDNLLCLDEASQVIPGHGPPTTIGREVRFNPYLERHHPRAQG